MSSNRKLAAIMFTDIVGYTAMMGSDEGRGLVVLRKSRDIQKSCIERHHGIWLKEMGDGVLARFGSALDAVHAAIMIQKEAHEELDEKIRIGIHLGDVTLDSGDVFGDGVNIASRLQSIADPGGIYISESMHAAIGSNREIESTYIGEVLLKNVKAPLKTYYIEESWLPCPSKAKIRSITAQKKPLTSIKSRVVVAFVVVVLGLLYFSRPFWLGVAGKGLDSP